MINLSKSLNTIFVYSMLYIQRIPSKIGSGNIIHIAMCLRVLRDALVSRSRATASERAMVRASNVNT